MLVVLSATSMLVDLCVAVVKVTGSVAIMQLKVSATLLQHFYSRYVGDNFY